MDETNLKKRIEALEEKLRSAEASRDTYKRLYEAERSIKDGYVILREHDRTKLIGIVDYASELLGWWDYLDKADGQQQEGQSLKEQGSQRGEGARQPSQGRMGL